jgi:hypothetical protein
MMETWIDAVQDVWATITTPGYKTVNAPYLLKQDGLPLSIDPADIEQAPIALTHPGIITKFEYSTGGPHIGYYSGATEFHVYPNADLAAIPSLIVWRGLIVKAATQHMTLGGLVELFILEDTDDQITGPIQITYGNEAPHWGFYVKWFVKERIEGQLTIATG